MASRRHFRRRPGAHYCMNSAFCRDESSFQRQRRFFTIALCQNNSARSARLVERVRIVTLGFVWIFLAWNHIWHCGAEMCTRLHFSFLCWQIHTFIPEDDGWGHKQRCINMFSKFPLPLPTPPPSHILPGLIYNAKVMMSGRVTRPKKRD